MSDRISVVLATYNGDRYLGEQLASLMAQRQLPDEVIVVDDGSEDPTPERLVEFQERAPFRVRLVLRNEHMGTWLTFEEGIEAASGDVIVLCDQDDRWREDKLSLLSHHLAARPDALMAFSDARLIDAEGTLLGRSRWRVAGFAPSVSKTVAADPFGPLLTRQAVSGCSMAFRRALVPALLPFPVDLHPGLPSMMYDRWISLVAAAAGSVITVPEKLVDYRIHPGQQVGIPALSVRRFAPSLALHVAQLVHGRAEAQRRAGYHCAHLDEIVKRLDAARLATVESDARLDAARRHLQFRLALGEPRRGRFGSVLREWRRGDSYRRFSLGLATAVADLTR